jgi:hypothetical protein
VSDLRTRFETAFRDAADALAPDSVPLPPSSETVGAWLCLNTVRSRGHWLDAAAEGARQRLDSGLDDLDEAGRIRWLHTASRGWVQRASGPFRALADALAPQVRPCPASVPALLRYWRITGRSGWLEQSLRALPSAGSAVDPVGAEALHAAWLATADPELLERAVAHVEGLTPEDVAIHHWPLLAELQGLDLDAFEAAEERVAATPAAQRLYPLAALCLPPLTLRIRYALKEELREGPVAEAITCPYPGLRIEFAEHSERHQVDITPIRDGQEGETLYDVAVVDQFIEMLLESVDRTALLGGGPRRRGTRKSRLRRR